MFNFYYFSPSIVKVFPLPVDPNMNTEALIPSNADKTISLTWDKKTS